MKNYFHVGVMKTGTTLLQQKILPTVCGASFAGDNLQGSTWGMPSLQSMSANPSTNSLWKQLNFLTTAENFSYNPDTQRRAFLVARQHWSDMCGGSNQFVYSNEILTEGMKADRSVVLGRLSSLVNNEHTNLLVTIREPVSALISLHNHLLVKGALPAKHIEFEAWWNHNCARPLQRGEEPSWSVTMFCYDRLLETLEASFTNGHIYLLPLEQLGYDINGYCNVLSQWLETSESLIRSSLNRSSSGSSFNTASENTLRYRHPQLTQAYFLTNRLLERWIPGYPGAKELIFRGLIRRTAAALSRKPTITPSLLDSVSKYYSGSSHRIATLCSAKLDEFGYPT